MFITFEGPEGSGKTSAIKKVTEYLKNNGYDIFLTREPGGTKISEKIREIILDPENIEMDKKTEALLYAASRRQHLIEKIWPALKENKIVLCDRYLDSSLAYQGFARKIGFKNVLDINLFATENTWPNLTILFDINPTIGLERIKANRNAKIDRLDREKIEFHDEVRNAFLKLAKKYPDRYVIVDASKDMDTVANNVIDVINKRLCKSKNI